MNGNNPPDLATARAAGYVSGLASTEEYLPQFEADRWLNARRKEQRVVRQEALRAAFEEGYYEGQRASK